MDKFKTQLGFKGMTLPEFSELSGVSVREINDLVLTTKGRHVLSESLDDIMTENFTLGEVIQTLYYSGSNVILVNGVLWYGTDRMVNVNIPFAQLQEVLADILVECDV